VNNRSATDLGLQRLLLTVQFAVNPELESKMHRWETNRRSDQPALSRLSEGRKRSPTPELLPGKFTLAMKPEVLQGSGPMTDPGSTSLELELELTGHETDEELETAIRAKLGEILGVFGRTAAESAWGRGEANSVPAEGKSEFVKVMQQDYVLSTSKEDQEFLLQGILAQARQHRDALQIRHSQ